MSEDVKEVEAARKRLHELVDMIPAEDLAGILETVCELIPELKTEVVPPERKLPEGVTLVEIKMKDEKNAEGAETVFHSILSGKYEFKSAVNLETRVRTVMHDKSITKGVGSPILMEAADKDNAWSLQQTIDWAYREIIEVVAVRREGSVVEVAYIHKGIKAPPPKEKLIYSFKKTDGWSLKGEERKR